MLPSTLPLSLLYPPKQCSVFTEKINNPGELNLSTVGAWEPLKRGWGFVYFLGEKIPYFLLFSEGPVTKKGLESPSEGGSQ